MPIASEFVEAEDLLVVVWDGIVTGEEWETFARDRIAAEPDWPLGSRRLVDVTTLDPSSLSPADVATNTDLYRDRTTRMVGARTAVIAAGAWDIATEWERSIDRFGSRTIVFNYLPEACGWLGLDPDLAREVVTRLRRELRAA